MEFHEKLQYLRKQNQWTQEQLAEKLYVSRTAVSKWESGKGYPNIESLKAISKIFAISIDELLSGEELIAAAEIENRETLHNMYTSIIGLLDLLVVLCIILPLYGNPADGTIQSVNLFSFNAVTTIVRIFYWIVFLALIAMGTAELLLSRGENWKMPLQKVSLLLSVLAILFFAAVKEPYVIALLFLFFLIKLFLIMKQTPMKNS
ncbi:MAG: helix-turn-helix transcriptional regulator [Peptococcaceae bacterium]|nr:helix-turn-helix transcriptional regulator [Peptococcaceae bacterium]